MVNIAWGNNMRGKLLIFLGGDVSAPGHRVSRNPGTSLPVLPDT